MVAEELDPDWVELDPDWVELDPDWVERDPDCVDLVSVGLAEQGVPEGGQGSLGKCQESLGEAVMEAVWLWRPDQLKERSGGCKGSPESSESR